MNLKLIIGIAAIAFVIIFVLQNMEVVRVEFLIWNIEASRALIYLTILVTGALVGWIGRSLKGKKS